MYILLIKYIIGKSIYKKNKEIEIVSIKIYLNISLILF